jgi:hydrogenase/urease accessory protein HupE
MKSDLVLTLIRHPLVEADHMDCMVALAGERFYSATFRKN